jgi:hypothetical protein
MLVYEAYSIQVRPSGFFWILGKTQIAPLEGGAIEISFNY